MVDSSTEPADNSHSGERAEPRDTAHALRRALHEVECLVGEGAERAQQAERVLVPAWRRATEGETRWPVSLVVVIAIALQLVLPGHLALHPSWLLPGVEAVLLTGLIAANPRRIDRHSNTIVRASA